MSRPLIGTIALLGAGVFGIASARAQAAGDIALVVRAAEQGSVRCFEVDALRQRIAHYSATGLERARELRLELDVDAADSAELRVYRGAELAARRRFGNLPAACADRRDAVALSIAMALEGVMRELAPAREPDASASALEAGTVAGDSTAASASTAVQPTVTPDESTERNDRVDAVVVPPRPQRELAPNEPVSAKPVPAEEEGESDAGPQDDTAQRASPARGPGSNGAMLALALHLGGRWLAAALPAPVWTGALGAELGLGRHFAIDASAMTSTTADSSFAGARAQTRLTGGELLGCGVIRFGNFAAQGCLGAVAAACAASGENYPVQFPAATVLWAASTGRLALRWPDARRVSLRIVAQGHVNMVRPELRVDGSSAELVPSWFGASAGLDMLVSLE